MMLVSGDTRAECNERIRGDIRHFLENVNITDQALTGAGIDITAESGIAMLRSVYLERE